MLKAYHLLPSDELSEEICARWQEVATWMDTFLPDSRERSLALTQLQQSMFWALASRRPKEKDHANRKDF